MGFNQRFANGQSQPELAAAAAAVFICAVETVEHIRQIFRFNTVPAIADPQINLFGQVRAQPDPAACRGVPQRVLDQVFQHLYHAAFIHVDLWQIR